MPTLGRVDSKFYLLHMDLIFEVIRLEIHIINLGIINHVTEKQCWKKITFNILYLHCCFLVSRAGIIQIVSTNMSSTSNVILKEENNRFMSQIPRLSPWNCEHISSCQAVFQTVVNFSPWHDIAKVCLIFRWYLFFQLIVTAACASLPNGEVVLNNKCLFSGLWHNREDGPLIPSERPPVLGIKFLPVIY